MGIYEETLVIYMGDNGFMFGEHGLFDKRVAYETSSRVPMLMQCPEIIEGGTVVDQVVANIDIAPTVMQAMGLKKPPHMDGQSFLPLAQLPPAQRKSIPWRDYFSIRLLLGTELPADADPLFAAWRPVQVHDLLWTLGH